MNILTAIVLLLFLLLMFRGYRRGFIKSLASVISLAASVILVSFVTPYVSQFLQSQTPIYTYVMERCQETFRVSLDEAEEKSTKKTAQDGAQDTGEKDAETELSKELQADESSGQTGTELSKELQTAAIEQLPLPTILKNMLKNNNTTKTYQELAVTGFNEYVPKFMANLIMNIISFVLTWILIASFIWLAIMTLDVIANLPIIHGINQVLGLALGAVQALVITWIGFLAVTMFSSTAAGEQLLKMISESRILSMIYDGNIFLNFLQGTVQRLL